MYEQIGEMACNSRAEAMIDMLIRARHKGLLSKVVTCIQ